MVNGDKPCSQPHTKTTEASKSREEEGDGEDKQARQLRMDDQSPKSTDILLPDDEAKTALLCFFSTPSLHLSLQTQSNPLPGQ